MRVGVVILPESRWSVAGPMWRRAEELGFDHAWTYDHLAWRSLRDGPWFGAIPTLTAAALVTEHIGIGPLVASPNFRHPVPFAKELITLDDVSGGRLIVGIGAGGEGWDATMMGHAPWPPPERAARFGEFVELTDQLLCDPAVSYSGRFYSASEARTHPGCLQQPRVPFAIAAARPRTMAVAARFGQTWVTTGERPDGAPAGVAVEARHGAEAVARQMAALDHASLAIGRDPASLGRMVLAGPVLDEGLQSVEAFRDTVGRYSEIGVTDFVVHWPRPSEPYAGDLATFERVMSEWRG